MVRCVWSCHYYNSLPPKLHWYYMQSDNKLDQIWDPYRYLEQTPGKGMRTKHIDAFNAILEAPDTVVERVKTLIERLHTVSLLLDDIEDNASLRRGRPVAHSVFGVPRTINSASFVMLDTLRETSRIFPESQSILFDELIALHEGQSLDLYWRDTNTCPTESEYNQMVQKKTGGLYRLAVRLLQQYSPHKNLKLVEVADIFGLIYQIQDDLLNLSSERYKKNKGFAEDITEGKYSFPVIHCLESAKNAALSDISPADQPSREERISLGAELAGILRQHTNCDVLKEHAVHCLLAAGSIRYTQQTIERHYNAALEAIERLDLPNPQPLKTLLDKLVVIRFQSQQDDCEQ